MGQTVFDRIGSIRTGAHYQTYNIKTLGETLTQFALPLQITLPLGRAWTVQASTAGIHAELADYTYEYAGDTQARVTYTAPGEWLLATAGVNTPTGQSRLNADEREISYVIARNALGMPYPAFGQGWQANAGIALAHRLNKDVVIGLGGSYVYTHPYNPWEGIEDELNSGDEYAVIAGIDYHPEGLGKFSFDTGVTYYRTDKVNDAWAFQLGRKLYFDARWLVSRESVSWEVYLVNRALLNNRVIFYDYLEREPKNSNGHEIETGLNMLIPSSDWISWRFAAEGRIFAEGSLAMGDATLGGAGGGFVLGKQTGWQLDVRTMFLTGKLDMFRTKESITGVEVMGMVGYNF